MGQVIYLNKFDSAEELDRIMFSYRRHSCDTVMIDRRGLTVLLSMLVQGEVTITEYIYPYDCSIRDDGEIMAVYNALAPCTKWKQYARTKIEELRINALKEMRQEGAPFYEDYICYQEGRVNVHCGNIDPTRLLTRLVQHPELRSFYIFTRPDLSKENNARYYCFEFPDSAHDMAVRYQESNFDLIRQASEKSGIIYPNLPTIETEPTE